MSRLAFVLLLAGEAVFFAATVIGGWVYPGYDHLRQYISELGATGAVTGPAVSWWGFFLSGVLIMAFCLIAALVLRRNGMAVGGMAALAYYAYGLVNSAFYPCAFECAREVAAPAQMMHDLIGGTGYLAGVLGVLLAGLSATRNRAAWLAPLGIICAVIGFAGLSGLVADIDLRGLSQRVLEAAITIFLLAFGWAMAAGRMAASFAAKPL